MKTETLAPLGPREIRRQAARAAPERARGEAGHRWLCFALALAAACGESAPALKPAEIPDAAPPPPDAGFPDSGPPPAPPPDAGPPPDAEPRVECPCNFIEEFNDQSTVDSAATTATVDFSGAGSARVTGERTLRAAGSGGAGALEVTADRTLPAGDHELASLTVRGATLEILGDATVRVTGAVSLSAGAQLTVLGKLTLIAGGDVSVDCSRLVTAGDLEIEQPSGNIAVGCGLTGGLSEVLTDLRPTGSSGKIAISTRGSLALSNGARLYTGSVSDGAGRSGDIEIRTYGGAQLGPGDGLVVSGGSAGQNGDVTILTEGPIVTDGARVAGGDSTAATPTGGTVRMRARGAVTFRNGGNVLSSAGGSIEVVTESKLSLENGSFILTAPGGAQTVGTSVRLRARSLAVGSSQFPGDQSAVIARAGSRTSATLAIETIEEINILERATIGTPEVACIAGGDVTLSAEGGVNVGAQALVAAGASRAATGCAAAKGGSLTIVAGGTISSPDASRRAGEGSPSGLLEVRDRQTVRLGVLAAELAGLRQVTSRPLDIIGTAAMPSATTVTAGSSSPASYGGLHFLLSDDGSDYVPARHMPLPIQGGWRYGLMVEPRMFDDVSLDSFTITYR